jgi:prefoldin alpha subunit
MANEINRQQAAIEQKINELAEQSRVLEAYMNDILNREATVTRLIGEARLASSAIQNLVDESDTEALAPVGIGVYIKTVVPPVRKVLINLGAGVTIEKTREDSMNYVEARIKEFELALTQLLGQKQQIAMRMEQIQGQINQLLQQPSRINASPQPNPSRQAFDPNNKSASGQPPPRVA